MTRRLLIALAIPMLLVAGCSSDASGDDYSQVCTDSSGVRVDDSLCGNADGSGSNAFLWYFILSGLNRPAYGAQVTHNTYYVSHGGTTTRPSYASSISKGVPKDGAPGVSGKPTVPTVPKPGTKVNPPPKVSQYQPQDKPNPNIKPNGPVNKPPAPAPKPAPPKPKSGK